MTRHPSWRSRIQISCAGKQADIAVDQIRTLSMARLLKRLDALKPADAEKLRQTLVEMHGQA